jgi:hypothetical protein
MIYAVLDRIRGARPLTQRLGLPTGGLRAWICYNYRFGPRRFSAANSSFAGTTTPPANNKTASLDFLPVESKDAIYETDEKITFSLLKLSFCVFSSAL